MKYGISLAAVAACMVAAFAAHAQNSAAPAPQNQSGKVVMAPIPDQYSTYSSGEHHFGPHVLSDADHAIFAQAFAAAEHGDWQRARALAAQGKDKIAHDIVTWRYLLDETSGASFDEFDSFLRAHPDWPRREILLARAEKAMPESTSANSVLGWFGNRAPSSGFGDIRLGEALIKTGKRKEGIDLIRKGWIGGSFEAGDEVAILTKHSDLFTPEVHKKRLERLFWDGELTGAQRQIARVEADDERMAEVRIKLLRGLGSPHAIVAKLPERLRNDPGILFAEAHAYRRNNDNDKAEQLLLRASGSKAAHDFAEDWWGERQLEAREAIKDGKYRTAYNLVSQSHLDSGTDYTDAEFLAGWLKLRFLKEARGALKHFEALADAAGTPISRARAQYWLGRTEEALVHRKEAWQHYHAAAQFSATFYGQLAQARIEAHPMLHLDDSDADTSALRADFDASERTYAMRVLGEMGEDDWLRPFASRLMLETADGPHMKLLAELMLKLNSPALAVRAAKQASYNGALMLTYSHPMRDVPHVANLAKPPEPALTLGIVRQESEFDPDAVSHAGALGIMQIMPGGGRRTASAHGLHFSVSDLTSDPNLNMQIGQAELSDYLAEWGGSYILAIASYNAGDHNVRKWITTYGDPRDLQTDPIDWIELIPFGETRNYVQRVLENTLVYRNRLAGADQKLGILADLYRPRSPDVTILEAPPAKSKKPSEPTHMHKKKKTAKHVPP